MIFMEEQWLENLLVIHVSFLYKIRDMAIGTFNQRNKKNEKENTKIKTKQKLLQVNNRKKYHYLEVQTLQDLNLLIQSGDNSPAAFW